MQTGQEAIAMIPDQLKCLRAIASGQQPEVQQRRYRWFVSNGYLIAGKKPEKGRHRYVQLTSAACEKIGVKHDHAVHTILLSTSGYVPTPTEIVPIVPPGRKP